MSADTTLTTRSLPARASWSRIVVWALLVAAAGYGLRSWLVSQQPAPLRTQAVVRGDITLQTLASGRIVPREELFVRSLVAGVLAELTAHPGDQVKKGDPLAVIRIVADPVILSEARAQVRLAEQRVARSERELGRVKPYGGGVALSGIELAKAEDDLRVARTELDNANERVRLISQGAAGERGTRSTRVLSPITGTVLAVPVAIGDVIGDTNSYRDGTTLAVVADMSQLLFKGQIEEAHVGKLALGMPAAVRIGALEGTAAPGVLSWISPRATVEATGPAASTGGNASTNTIAPLTATSTGITRFELWVTLTEPPRGARAGYSATAELSLDKRTNVLVVEERALRFEEGKALATVVTSRGGEEATESREVQVGISDGLKIEIMSGLKAGDRLVYPDESAP
jgi:HlyD family secretion protein